MTSTVENHREEIAELCRKYRVQRLELFGSAVGDRFDTDSSDVDFLVEFQPLADGEHADAYFGLLESLQSVFSRHVDLVMTQAIRNPYFLQSIERTRTIVYAA